MAAQGLRSDAARIGPAYALASIVLHAGLLYAVIEATRLERSPHRLEPTQVVWLEASVLALPNRPVRSEPAPPSETPASAPVPAPLESAPESEPESEPESTPEPESEPGLEPLQDEPASEPERSAPRSVEPPPSTVLTVEPATVGPRPDLEDARRAAVARVLEEQAREQRYRDFGANVFDAEEPPPAEPGADQDVFAPRSSSRPGLLSPSKARTRVGRALADLCHDFSGGISVFGLFSLCAEEGERADVFGHLRPAYMEKLPLCTEIELSDEQLAAARISDLSTIERTVVKCRLVDRDEVLTLRE